MLANKYYTILFKNNILTFQIAKDGNDIITKKIKIKEEERSGRHQYVRCDLLEADSESVEIQ